MSRLELYRDEVREAIRNRDGSAVFNGSVEHASIIAQEAFTHAKDSVRILTFKLDPDCYAQEPVLNAAQFFLADPSHKLQILIETELWDQKKQYKWAEHPLLKGLLSVTVAEGTTFSARRAP